MGKWYKNEDILKISVECDLAYEKKDLNRILDLSDLCWEKGHDLNNGTMERAKYLYDSFTSLGDWIQLDSGARHLKSLYDGFAEVINRYEVEHEKCLYLCRASLKLAKEVASEGFGSIVDKKYFDEFYNSLIVNYSNLLSQTGRLIRAIYTLEQINNNLFPMVSGNLGLKILNLADLDYDKGHAFLLCQDAYHNLVQSLTPELLKYNSEAYICFENSIENLEAQFEIEDLKSSFNVKKENLENMSSEEINYRIWCSKHGLSLNSLNDVRYDIDVAYDPVHLPTMILPMVNNIIPSFHGLFNQIKQEYVSARYLAYDGLINRNRHFSDKEVFMIDTLDYPVYGLSVEKIKAAYRSVYAIFDRIAYFLNFYFDLNITERNCSYKTIWSKNSLLHENASKNYPLLGFKWICKDIANRSVSKFKNHIDPTMEKISDVRNKMEHRYFKIVDNKPAYEDKKRVDEMAFLIEFTEFEELTIELLRNAREAIMLLVMTVYVEEGNKRQTMGPKIKIGGMHLSEYEDDWKQIF
ncbi:MAG: LA2681 family HEPN domain-containing protein [Anaerostipes caccae]